MRLYFETTMFNYYFDANSDGHEDTVRLFKSIREGKHEVFTSGIAIRVAKEVLDDE